MNGVFKKFKFDQNSIIVDDDFKFWPHIYILYSSNKESIKCYVGQTNNINQRIINHINDRNKDFKEVITYTNKLFNISFTYEIESGLIELMSSHDKLLLSNQKSGNSHNFFEKNKTPYFMEEIWKHLDKLGLVKNSLKTIKNSLFYQINPLKPLTNHQNNIIEEIKNSIKSNKLNSYLIKGQSGTGKTLCATALFYSFCNDNELNKLKIAYTSGNTQFRDDLYRTIKNKSFYFNSKNIMSPSQIIKDYVKNNYEKYDYIIVDESQRLKKREALSNYDVFDKNSNILGLNKMETNELEWLMRVSKNQIIFYDDNQTIKNSDLNINEEIEKCNFIKYNLVDELRMENADEYLNLLKNILFKEKNKIDRDKLVKYNFKVFKSFTDMYNMINLMNKQHNYSFLLSGLGFPKNNFKNTTGYSSKKKQVLEKEDFNIDGINLYWNVITQNWVDSEKNCDLKLNINEVGCVHVIQGKTLNYAAVIISEEIDYINKKLVIYKDRYNDRVMKNNYDEKIFLKYILNIYYVLLTRGVKGTFIYIKNVGLRKKIEEIFKKYNISDLII